MTAPDAPADGPHADRPGGAAPSAEELFSTLGTAAIDLPDAGRHAPAHTRGTTALAGPAPVPP
uniref:hypothetical protein n=1 Tax=Kineosporia sp. A_224 TaxID=1962180 RepID=UPI00117A8E83